ncbi:MAG TPA: radical SAM protein, partial [Anaerolineales bacterium]|nr:radical SAM protein [Anaerolineales bacterium]
PFKCLQRVDLVTESVVAALASAGCKTVWLGAESGSQKILDAMDKGDTVGDIYNAARQLRRVGIEVGFFLQFGYPGETWDDIQLTLKMVRECQPDDIGISVSYPLPGTKFFERVKLELGEKQNWIDSNDLAMLYRGPYPTEFYRILHGRVHHEFRARRAFRRPTLKSLAAVPRNLAGLLRAEWQLRQMAA